ncbi:MAG: hypothetical protein WAX14_02100 [Rhodococcus sp. (in: high G+C Gram-positive bacteria)]
MTDDDGLSACQVARRDEDVSAPRSTVEVLSDIVTNRNPSARRPGTVPGIESSDDWRARCITCSRTIDLGRVRASVVSTIAPDSAAAEPGSTSHMIARRDNAGE